MSNKTRKHIWPVSLAMSIAIVGALAAFLVLAANPGNSSAHGPDDPATHDCSDKQGTQAGIHDGFTDSDHPKCVTDDGNGNGDGNGDNGMMGDAVHATMPMDFGLEGLDNGARLNWVAPETVADNAMVVAYQIDRDAWNELASHPINMYGDATIKVYAHETAHSDLGLAYETVYTYMVRAVVRYNVEGWWDMLDCVEMNDAVSPMNGEPAIGADTDGTTYCKLYDNLSAEAMVVVQRAYAGLDAMAYTYYGEWSYKRALETAESGGRLEALLDPPTMVRSIYAVAACEEKVTVSWQAPIDLGTVPASDRNGVYVGPDYIGADGAGREEVGEDATSVTYQVERMVNNGPWTSVTADGTTYTDSNVDYDSTYKYRVRAMNVVGLVGPWSMVTEVLTEPDQPLQPTGLVVQATGPNTVELEWQAPEDSDTNPLWRTMKDFDDAVDDDSSRLTYVIERQVLNLQGEIVEDWNDVRTQAHKYADEFEDNRTQAWEDEDAPAGLVNYRVSAWVDNCNRSPAHQKNAVEVTAPTAAFAGSVEATSASGAVSITWNPADNATSQVVIAVNPADDTDFCLAVKGSSDDTHTCTGLTSGTSYVVLVIALHSGGYTLGNVVTHTAN